MDASKLQRRNATQNSIRFGLSMVVLTAALLTTTLAVPAFERAQMGGLAAGHGGWGADVRSFLRNPIDYFSQRSPGARGAGQLIQSKHKMFKLPRNGVKPHEQVLSNVRYGTPDPFINDIVPSAGPGLIDFTAPVPAIVGPPISGPSGGPSPVVPVGSANSPGATPAVTTVPETSTWLMLIWGMALVGTGLRSPHRPLAKRPTRMGFRAQI